MITIVNKSLIHVKTDISEKEIEYILEAMLEKHADEMETFRIPVDGMFTDPKRYEGITYPLVLNWDENILKLYQFIYNDSVDEAQARLQEWNEK